MQLRRRREARCPSQRRLRPHLQVRKQSCPRRVDHQALQSIPSSSFVTSYKPSAGSRCPAAEAGCACTYRGLPAHFGVASFITTCVEPALAEHCVVQPAPYPVVKSRQWAVAQRVFRHFFQGHRAERSPEHTPLTEHTHSLRDQIKCRKYCD